MVWSDFMICACLIYFCVCMFRVCVCTWLTNYPRLTLLQTLQTTFVTVLHSSAIRRNHNITALKYVRSLSYHATRHHSKTPFGLFYAGHPLRSLVRCQWRLLSYVYSAPLGQPIGYGMHKSIVIVVQDKPLDETYRKMNSEQYFILFEHAVDYII